jgi:hypothetical protein
MVNGPQKKYKTMPAELAGIREGIYDINKAD